MEKVSVHEHYGNSERNLRNKAVEELNKVKAKIQEGEGKNVKKPNKEWQTVWEESDGKRSVKSGWVNKEEVPKVMMMRVQPLEELEDQRVIYIQKRGRLLDAEYNEVFRTHEVDQQRLNRVARECDQRPDKAGLIEALVDQIKFDSQMTRKYYKEYRKERDL